MASVSGFIAFEGNRRLASGELAEVARKTKIVLDRSGRAAVLIFDAFTGRQVEIDFRGTLDDVMKRLAPKPTPEAVPERKGPGRPRLGVVAREVTLLPRHWEWLNSQSGGASVVLRQLVDQARKANAGKDEMREAQDSVYRFMSTMAGNLPAYEEALRALYRGTAAEFDQTIRCWPKDVRDHTVKLADRVFALNDSSVPTCASSEVASAK